jgi:hypothetical protein
MTFEPVLPGPILAVVAVALIGARLVTLRQVLLVTGAQRRTAALRWSGMTLAVLLLLAALTRPGTGDVDTATTAAAPTAAPNVFFVVDRSVDSAVADYGGAPRIDGMRADIDAVVQRYPTARFAVIGFADRPALDWPLSDDTFSLGPTVAALTVIPGPADAAQQVDAGAAANVLRYQLIQAGQQYPLAPNLVFYLGSGAGGSRAPQGRFDPGPGMVDGGAVLGYGTGAPDGGAPLDEAALRRISDELGVSYAHREPGQPLDAAVPEPADATAAEPIAARTEWYWVLALAVAALLLAEIYQTVRDLRRTRIRRQEVTR